MLALKYFIFYSLSFLDSVIVLRIFNHLVKYTSDANKTTEEINPCVDRMARYELVNTQGFAPTY